ncbi:sugar ABC transporter ATP-binding protein [uncultured Agrobacterium sp.]|uniref:sugar ABC transporter ATP-binding protein n=1 Tax=uncultured Agrobacterium sp. TaxID=157277 RepID=UPI0025D807C0|nr:sugar ABC transporter ATP-binding protein [uncultured Agrobacterium sp.]
MDNRNRVAICGRALTKIYGSTKVVENVDVEVGVGRLRAVVGENGAGKSTLMKMLTGITKPDQGRIEIDGLPVSFERPLDAISHGIAIVHQELHHVPMLSVVDNLMLGHKPLGGGRNGPKERKFAAEYLQMVGLQLDPATPVSRLSAAEAQLLEIAKALSRKPKVIIFDEPTAALPPADVERLLALVRKLKLSGHAILYISHHLSEVMALADDITVLRDGRVVSSLPVADASVDGLIKLMVGRTVTLGAAELAPPAPETVLSVRDAATKTVSGVNFDLKAGEIIGFVGLIGSGMHDAALLVAGAEALRAGEVQVSGKALRQLNVSQALANGIAIVPEERKTQAIYPDLSVISNMHSGRLNRYTSLGFLLPSLMRAVANDMVARFNIKLRKPSQPIRTLSGGNQQKVVLARCIQGDPKVLVLSEPTRGVDVGAKADIHKLLVQLASRGMAIIVVSSELEEALSLSHRVAVFSERRMVAVLDRSDAHPEKIMALATPKRNLELVS